MPLRVRSDILRRGLQVVGRPAVRFAVIVALASLLSGFVAYRLGLHRSSRRFARQSFTANDRKGDCIDFHDAGSHIGETSCVAGRVLRVYTSRGGNTFLDFCTDYRQCPFTAVIFASDRNNFGDLNSLGGQQVEIQGPISVYQERAEIIIRDPKQIRVVP